MSTEQPRSQADDRVHVAAETPVAFRGGPSRSRWARLPITTIARAIRRAFLAVLAVLFLAGAGLVTYSVMSGNWTIVPILSGSMRPGFPVGGVVAAERTAMSALAVGDVILFQNPHRPSERMVHRIIQLKLDESGQPVVDTKGDANNTDDPWTVGLQGQSVYVAQFTLPLLGYVAVNTTPGINLMIGGVILLLVALSTLVSRDRPNAAEKTGASSEAPRPAGVTASASQDGIPG